MDIPAYGVLQADEALTTNVAARPSPPRCRAHTTGEFPQIAKSRGERSSKEISNL